jgi:uncharacterized protein (TIGR03437 family)
MAATIGSLFLLALSSLSGPLQAQSAWITQQSARLVVGQPSFTRQAPIASRETIGGAAGVAYGGDILVIADGNRVGSQPVNNRVLIYRNVSSFIPRSDAELEQNGLCPACVGLPDVVLGQPDFDTFLPSITTGFQNPTGVATDGVRIAVADTNNNRVVLWNSIPTLNGTLPDVVVGQDGFDSNSAGTSSTTMRGPQGVWFDGGRLFVADTQNSRVLIYNSIPASDGAAADVVLGQPDFDTRPEPDLTQSNVNAAATSMLDPVSVTVNNGKMFVTDLGANRILIFNSVPTSNGAPADVVIGQPDMESLRPNNQEPLCPQPEPPPPDDTPDDTTDDIIPIPPARCDRTLSFPRFALSDGKSLFVSDGGNDRILIFNDIPAENAPHPDVVLGQADFDTLFESDGAASVRAPQALAHDGTNLYVADPFARRVLVFTPAEDQIAQNGLRNSASFAIRAFGFAKFERNATADQELGVTIDGIEYSYTAEEGDPASLIRDNLMAQIANDPDGKVTVRPTTGEGNHAQGRVKFSGQNRAGEVVTLRVGNREYKVTVRAGDAPGFLVDQFNFFIKDGPGGPDPLVVSERDPFDIDTILMTALDVGEEGNSIAYSVEFEADTQLTAEAEGATLAEGSREQFILLFAKEDGVAGNSILLNVSKSNPGGIDIGNSGGRMTGGSDARELPQGTLTSIFGEDFSEGDHVAQFDGGELPTELGGVRVYVNGMRAPLTLVSPTQINFQLPWELEGTSCSVYVWRRLPDGTVKTSVPRAADITRASPGIFAYPGPEPRQAVALHGQGKATGTIAVTANASDSNQPVSAGVELTIIVNGREYRTTTTASEGPESIRDRLVEAVNSGDGDPDVVAAAGVVGFFSSRASITLKGEPREGDVVTVFVRDRGYSVTVFETDTLRSIRNRLVFEINSGRGDTEVTARRVDQPGDLEFHVIARALGTIGNDIPFSITITPDGSTMTVEKSTEGDFLENGRTPPVVFLTAREAGRQGNDIGYSTDSSDTVEVQLTASATNLCCGNEEFALVTEDNPAIPGETLIFYGTGLGLTAPLPVTEGLGSGQPTPSAPFFTVPFVADDFVSSLAGAKTAQVSFAGLAPNLIGVYQINLKLIEDLPDDPATRLTIAQRLFISNVVTVPVKNIRPRPRDGF